MGAMMPPPQQALDPQSQYLAAALQALGKTPQQGNAQGLAGNLLADALMQYKLGQIRQPPTQPGGSYLNMGGDPFANGPG
jgi:hypothetical protein